MEPGVHQERGSEEPHPDDARDAVMLQTDIMGCTCLASYLTDMKTYSDPVT